MSDFGNLYAIKRLVARALEIVSEYRRRGEAMLRGRLWDVATSRPARINSRPTGAGPELNIKSIFKLSG